MQVKHALRLAAAAAFFCHTATWAVFECDVKINSTLIYANGIVSVNHSGRNSFTHLCSLNGESGGVSAVTCSMWLATLQNIQSKNGTAQFYYPGTGSCATLPTYDQSPKPTYIGNITP